MALTIVGAVLGTAQAVIGAFGAAAMDNHFDTATRNVEIMDFDCTRSRAPTNCYQVWSHIARS